MKRTKRVIALLLAAVLAVGCLGFAAYAADGADLPTVVFDAQTKEFRFENCGPNGTDLFRDFKNAMPGDNLVQHIRVKVENAGLDTVKIMLRSGESNADYATLLGMKVQSDGSWVRDDSIEHPATLTAVIPQLSGETITDELKKGRVCMVRVLRGENVHWLCVVGADEDDFFVLDPAKDDQPRSLAEYEKVYALGIVK